MNSSDSSRSSEATASDDENTWISWYVGLRGNDYFCEVDEEFIQDDFNLSGLSTMVPYYENALDLILDVDIPLDSLSEEEQEVVETSAEVLYGLIHARFVLSTRGMQKMVVFHFVHSLCISQFSFCRCFTLILFINTFFLFLFCSV